jgi:hypothetical protein
MKIIQTQRNVVAKKRNELAEQEERLKALYNQKSQEICPFHLGDEIEYEQGKKGKIEEIYFPSECWISLEEQEPNLWAVTGKKINKTGKPGKKNYHPVSNKTHLINGTSCRRKTFDEYLNTL